MQTPSSLYILLICFLVAACTGDGKSNDDTASTIIALAKKRSQAVVTSDTATMSSILARDFRYINIWGESLTREKYLRNNASLGPDSRWISQDLDSIDVNVLNENAAVITFRVLDRFIYQGQAYENHCRSTFVYEKHGDDWKCVIGHTTKVE